MNPGPISKRGVPEGPCRISMSLLSWPHEKQRFHLVDLPDLGRPLFGPDVHPPRSSPDSAAEPAAVDASALDGRAVQPAPAVQPARAAFKRAAAAAALLCALALTPGGAAWAVNLRNLEFTFIGWSSDLCSCAIETSRFSPSDVDRRKPSAGSVGTLTLAVGSTQTQEQWRYKSGLFSSYEASKANEATLALLSAGYSDPGTVEYIRDETLAGHGGLQPILMTAAGFAPSKIDWPEAPYRLAQVHYAPFSTCGLLIFESREPEGLVFRMASFPDTTRRTRARAHVTNGLLLIKSGRIEGGVAELQIAAEMDPTYATARYHYASYLATLGKYDQALNELKAAITYDRKYAGMAVKAPEFQALRKDPKFRKMVKGE